MTQSRLEAVYGATSRSELSDAYDEWASTYDSDMGEVGYRHPAIALGLLTRHVPAGSAPLLDAGAGTGLVGELLGTVGYPAVDGLDASEGMLSVARQKGVYRELHQGFLGEPLPFEDDRYAAVVSTGVFTAGHVGAEGLPELFRVTRVDGIVVLSVKVTVWETGIEEFLAGAVDQGSVSIVELTDAYESMPAGAERSPCLGVVCRVVQ
jgi:SAM-dependent methyltransferase